MVFIQVNRNVHTFCYKNIDVFNYEMLLHVLLELLLYDVCIILPF